MADREVLLPGGLAGFSRGSTDHFAAGGEGGAAGRVHPGLPAWHDGDRGHAGRAGAPQLVQDSAAGGHFRKLYNLLLLCTSNYE